MKVNFGDFPGRCEMQVKCKPENEAILRRMPSNDLGTANFSPPLRTNFGAKKSEVKKRCTHSKPKYRSTSTKSRSKKSHVKSGDSLQVKKPTSKTFTGKECELTQVNKIICKKIIGKKRRLSRSKRSTGKKFKSKTFTGKKM